MSKNKKVDSGDIKRWRKLGKSGKFEVCSRECRWEATGDEGDGNDGGGDNDDEKGDDDDGKGDGKLFLPSRPSDKFLRGANQQRDATEQQPFPLFISFPYIFSLHSNCELR